MTTPAPDVAPTLRQLAFGDLEHEIAQTRRLLERVPEARFDWRPHEKSGTLGELATHVADLFAWGAAIVTHDTYDFAATPPPQGAAAGQAALLARFDRNAGRLRDALEALDEGRLAHTWELRRGDQVLLAMPRLLAIRSMVLSHIVHHRGQLSVYLRLTGTPVPGLYGPSADER